MIRAGRMRHRITIERYSVTTDDYGEAVESWSVLCQLAAAVEPVAGREAYLARGEVSERKREITVRYSRLLCDVSVRDRVVYNDEVWDIDDVINLHSRNRYLKLTCTVQK